MPAPTCSFSASGFGTGGLNHWFPNSDYSMDLTVDTCLDPNGNMQVAEGGGRTGAVEPTWNTILGGHTASGSATFVNWGPLNSAVLGSEILLTWTSTDATSASIDGGVGSVPINGSVNAVVTTAILGYNGGDWRSSWCQGKFTLTVTGPGGTATCSAIFYVFYGFWRFVVFSFAPVNSALADDGYSLAMPTLPQEVRVEPWQPNTYYSEGWPVNDSNTDLEFSQNSGVSGPTPPLWRGVDDVTTESTGLKWQNLGAAYGAVLGEGACGPLKGGAIGGDALVGFAFSDAVIPNNCRPSPTWEPGHYYNLGDPVNDLLGNSNGIGIAICIQPGTSGLSQPTVFGSSAVNGSLIPEGGGSTVVWQAAGILAATLNWSGVLHHAAKYCPAMGLDTNVRWAGKTLGPGSVNSSGRLPAVELVPFLAHPAGYDFWLSLGSTADIEPCDPLDPCCIGEGIQWVSAKSESCGFMVVDFAGAWVALEMPFQPEFPGPAPTCDLSISYPVMGAALLTWTSENANSAYLIPFGGAPIAVAVNGSLFVHPAEVTRYDLSVTGSGGQATCSVWVLPPPIPTLPIRLLPYLKIPTGQGQSVNELDGESSIAGLDVEAIDPSEELKYLATKPEVVGKTAILKMGFEGMNLSDFVPMHAVQISDVGRSADGWMKFGCRDSLALLDRALWFCGGPQPVALPWLYDQAYTVGQYAQDSNGNIQQCIVAGITDARLAPIWPGTYEPGWVENTYYTIGSWALDGNSNLQQVTTVPGGRTDGESGTSAPTWSTTLGGTTVDSAGGHSDGPITWTLVAINELGQTVADGTVTWELVAMPSKGAFGGSQAFYLYVLYESEGEKKTPQPPASYSFTSNQYPTLDSNPRYIYGNPIDVLLVAFQNELGIGQDPLLPPIVTTDPNNPSNALVFAPNPAWQQYVPGDDSTLINPNPFINLDNILAIRDYQVAGRKCEWVIKRPVTAKQWIQDEILKPLGLYMFVHNDGTIDLKSMGVPPPADPTPIDEHSILGTPDQGRLAVVNVVTIRGDVDDQGAYSAARVYDAELTFAQQRSIATYLQQFSQSAESNGLREAWDSYGIGYLTSDRIFRRHGFGTPEYQLKLFLSQIRLEIGDFILLSHPLMMDYESSTGKLGITNVLCEIIDKTPDYATGTVDLKVWDTRFMQLSNVYDMAALTDAIPDWGSATAAEKAQYMFISFWPGYYSDGTPGNVIATDASGPLVPVVLTVPSAPSGLQGMPGNTRAFLYWSESLRAASYNVKRATASGGPYTTVGSATNPFYTDTGLTNGVTYFYVVSGVNSAGEGADCTQISVTPVV